MAKTVTADQMKKIQQIYEEAHDKMRQLRIKRVQIVDKYARMANEKKISAVRSKIEQL